VKLAVGGWFAAVGSIRIVMDSMSVAPPLSVTVRVTVNSAAPLTV
jgi:hypothetical protein